ncbi:hypothetical protein [Salinicoccus albus]|uniref:hypothetical protein n=1 Tax=Salinicoccus albus TaxID=418756 RepID=UPI0012EA31A2|nr:hypothetical protein [Salinicoccus albus]
MSNIEKVMSISSYLIGQLKKSLALQKAPIENDRYAEFMKYDKEFHLILVSHNPNAEQRFLDYYLNRST